jgi:hypothetical protein
LSDKIFYWLLKTFRSWSVSTFGSWQNDSTQLNFCMR